MTTPTSPSMRTIEELYSRNHRHREKLSDAIVNAVNILVKEFTAKPESEEEDAE